jgi:hypothetical protein
MGDIRIKALKNGPLEVSGPLELTDSAGVQRPIDEDPIYLCRCGTRETSLSATAATKRWASRANAQAYGGSCVGGHSSSGLRSS